MTDQAVAETAMVVSFFLVWLSIGFCKPLESHEDQGRWGSSVAMLGVFSLLAILASSAFLLYTASQKLDLTRLVALNFVLVAMFFTSTRWRKRRFYGLSIGERKQRVGVLHTLEETTCFYLQTATAPGVLLAVYLIIKAAWQGLL